MAPGIACSSCHGPGANKEEESLFISLMNDSTKTVYTRCSDCHQFAANGGSDSEEVDD